MLDRSFARVTPKSLLFAGGHQPARRDLGISSLTVEDSIVPVQAVDLIKTPFCTVVELARADLNRMYCSWLPYPATSPSSCAT